MDCKEAIKHLYIETEDGSLSGEMTAAKEHVFGCPKCRKFFEEEKGLKSLLSERTPREKVPPDLKERIFYEIERASHFKQPKNMFLHLRRSAISVALISIVLVLIVLLGLYLYTGKKKESHIVVNEIASQHIKYLQNPDLLVDVDTSQPEELESWFKDKVDFLVKAPKFSGISLVGGRLCSLFNKPAAVLVYKNRGQTVSLFITDQPKLDISSLDMVDIDGKKLCRGFGKGLNVVMWRDRGLVYALVSEMKEMELLRLASLSN